MTDTAVLRIRVESSGISTASSSLTDLAKNSVIAERGMSSLSSMAKTAGIAIGGLSTVAVIGSLMREASDQAMRFEKSLSDLSAITGATGSDLNYLKKAALEMGQGTVYSASQAAYAIQLIASAKPDLLGNASALKEVTNQALILAEAAGVELPESADTLGTALNQFNLSADQSSRVINVLAAGAKYGSSEIADTSIALKNAGVSAAGANVSFEAANAAIQTLAAVGIKGGEAGTSLRNVILKLDTGIDQSLKPSVVGLSTALENLNNKNMSATDMVKLFGLENVNAASALVKNSSTMKQLETQITGTNTAYEQASVRTNNLDGDYKKLNASTEALAITLGEKLNPFIRSVIGSLTDLATATNEAIKSADATMIAGNIVNAENELAAAKRERIKLDGMDVAQYQQLAVASTGYANYLSAETELHNKQTAAKQKEAEAQKKLNELKAGSQAGTPTSQTASETPKKISNSPAVNQESAAYLQLNSRIEEHIKLLGLDGEAQARLRVEQEAKNNGVTDPNEIKKLSDKAAKEYQLEASIKAAKEADNEAAQQSKLSAEVIARAKESVADLSIELESNRLAAEGNSRAAAELTAKHEAQQQGLGNLTQSYVSAKMALYDFQQQQEAKANIKAAADGVDVSASLASLKSFYNQRLISEQEYVTQSAALKEQWKLKLESEDTWLKDEQKKLKANFNDKLIDEKEYNTASQQLLLTWAQKRRQTLAEQQTAEQTDMQKWLQTMRENSTTTTGMMTTVFNGFTSNISQGFTDAIYKSSSFSDAMNNAANSFAQSITQSIIQVMAQETVLWALEQSMGMSKSALGGFGSSSLSFGSLFSFDGGGFTGYGPRSGGVDGKGGFYAIMHPQETVIDHTKGQSSSGSNTTNNRSTVVNVNQVINTTGKIDTRTSKQIASDTARKQRMVTSRLG